MCSHLYQHPLSDTSFITSLLTFCWSFIWNWCHNLFVMPKLLSPPHSFGIHCLNKMSRNILFYNVTSYFHVGSLCLVVYHKMVQLYFILSYFSLHMITSLLFIWISYEKSMLSNVEPLFPCVIIHSCFIHFFKVHFEQFLFVSLSFDSLNIDFFHPVLALSFMK